MIKRTKHKDLNQMIKVLKKIQVKVGITADKNKPYENGLNTASVGVLHEFGNEAMHIPQRSFIREPLKDNMSRIKKQFHKEAQQVILGKQSHKVASGRIGALGVSIILERFKSNNWKSNSPLTELLKGSNKPLINTGQLRQSISYEVV